MAWLRTSISKTQGALRQRAWPREFLTGIIGLVLALALLAGASAGPRWRVLPSAVQPARADELFHSYVPLVIKSGASSVYVPLVIKSYPPLTVFGAEMASLTDPNGLQQMADANTSWVRRAAVEWREVEPTEGAPNWAALSGLEQELVNASTNGMRVVLVIRRAPDWALADTAHICGKVRLDKMGALASFVNQLVTRYSAYPYSVKHWEMWNEPDVDPGAVPMDSYFGCWGDFDDVYFDGGYYAEMLKQVYPQVKAADPQSQVLVGGLLLDCDPENPPPGKDCTPARFLEGILQNGGGPFFDGVSFHAYDYAGGILGNYSNPNWASAWNTTGPVSIAKAEFVQGVLADYSVTGKFLMNTESAVICGGHFDPPGQPPCQEVYETTKAYYVAQVYASAIALGLQANIWYTPLGWRNSGFLNPDLTPREAYTAYDLARDELRDAAYLGPVTSGDLGGVAGVKGYKFNRGDREVWLMWSLDGADHGVTFAGTPLAVYDVFGASSPPSSSQTVSLKPLYVEWP